MNSHLKNLSYMLVVQIANYLLPLINIPILARAFGPENLGLITYITAITAYFVLLVDYSFNFTGVRRISKEKLNPIKVFNVILTARIFLLLISIVLFSFSLYFIQNLRQNFLLLIIFFISCLVPVFTNMWFLQAHNNFKEIAIFNFITKLVVTVGIVFLIKSKDDILEYALLLNFSNLVIAIFSFIYICIKYDIKFRIEKPIDVFIYLKEDKFLFLSSIVTNLYTTTGIVILGALTTKAEVGYYGSAQKIIELAKNIIAMPIYQVIFPVLAKKFGENELKGLEAVKKIIPIFNLIVLIMATGLITLGYFIIYILFGIEFLQSYLILIILSFGLVAVFYGILIGGQIMLNLGMDRYFVKIQVIVSIFSIFLSYIVLPYGGAITIAIIWTISEIAITLYQIHFLRRRGIHVLSWTQLSFSSILHSVKYVLGR
ncbi:oligosaccharide flippase family protein [Acinetobacter sp. B10A]|uniref:oligosaccharide flippase family protein n=1 Tax=Acinetobacter baretiae TaxID=2605383 RepID=UPI001B3C8FC3|nr:oligosaccharide flippase family protein [Acinetobacter baretiae]MBF7685629.1 oligosaccharide flippase family protein [Acinetobacter baretiae]